MNVSLGAGLAALLEFRPEKVVIEAVEASPTPQQPLIDPTAVMLTLGLTAGAAVLLLILFSLLQKYLFICRPNELLVVAGKRHQLPTGELVDYTVVTAGSHWRMPFVQTVSRMDLGVMPIELTVARVLSHGGIPLDVHAVANVKISSDPRYVYNAVERFLPLPPESIRLTAKQTLEGALRDVLSQLTPEQVNEDRIEFANKLLETTSDVFGKLGLQLDTLKIQRVEDEAQYLVNLGRTQIANAVRDAENAENQASQEVAQQEAAARQTAELAQKQAEIAIAQRRNQLRAVIGQLEGQALSVELEADAATQQARAEAEQELQTLRSQLETKRLHAEIVLPAEAQRMAAEQTAEGAAAMRRVQGIAAAEVMTSMAEALRTAGPHAREMYVLSQLDTLVAQVAAKVREIHVREVHVVDAGDGRALPALTASYPLAVTAALRTLRELTGVDVPQILAGTADVRSTNTPLGASDGGFARTAARDGGAR